jgi:anti-sigma-K factor RskA
VSDPNREANTQDGEALQDMIALYALDALDADDRARVEHQLATDPRARSLLDEFLSTLSTLSLSEAPSNAAPVPTPGVKQRVFARIDADLYSSGMKPATSHPESAWERLTRALRAASPVLAVAGLVLAIGLGVWAISLQNQLSTARQELALLQQPGLRVASLPPTENAPTTAQIAFLSAVQSDMGLLTVSGLRPLPSNQTYQFWLLKGGQPMPAGIFSVNADGTGKLVVQSSEPIGMYQQAGITIEPAGGSISPTLTALVSIGDL